MKLTVVPVVEKWLFGLGVGMDPVHGLYIQAGFGRRLINLSQR